MYKPHISSKMTMPEYLFMCCLFLVCPSPISAHKVLVGSIGSAHGDYELIGLLKKPVPVMEVHISNDEALFEPISSVDGDTEFIKPRTNQDLVIDKAYRKAITKPILGVFNDEARLESKSVAVNDSEFIDPPANPDPDINKAHIKPMTNPGLSLSDNEARVEPKSFKVSDSEFIRPLNNPHSNIDKTHIKPMTRPSSNKFNGKAHVEPKRFSDVNNEFLKPPTNPVLILEKAHIKPTTMPVLSKFGKTHRKPISLANEARHGAHAFSEVTVIARNRHVSLAKSGDTNFAVTKDGNDGPFLPSPDCCYLKNVLDANNESPGQPTSSIDKKRVH